MGMYETIRDFPKQFAFEPKIENEARLKKGGKSIVVGMGGSHLAADLLNRWNPYLNLTVHQDYGLPSISEETLRKSLVIVSSYSGNTEETLDAYDSAKDRGLALAAVSIGGKLIGRAKADGVPYVQLPDTDIQPRSALGFTAKAILKLMGEEGALAEILGLSDLLKPSDYEDEGKRLAETLHGFVPIIYASDRNSAIAQNWKIKFNETGKIPAFWNVFPELNHNEMTGFDLQARTDADMQQTRTNAEDRKKLNEVFRFIFLRDSDDDPRVLRRMEVTGQMLRGHGFEIAAADLQGENVWHKIFGSLILADWAAYYTAAQYGTEPEQVPMVEEFKKLIAARRE